MGSEESSERSAARGMAEARIEVNWESSGMVERRMVRLLMFGDGGLEKETHMEK